MGNSAKMTVLGEQRVPPQASWEAGLGAGDPLWSHQGASLWVAMLYLDGCPFQVGHFAFMPVFPAVEGWHYSVKLCR